MSDSDLQKHTQLNMETLMSAQIETLYQEIAILKGLLREARPLVYGERGNLYERIGKILGIP